eukprot:CAMPEP_0197183112 /NCGR_PEP_ID=MMETSP1423-20130617/7476_1 /TAXON_ID=476441 /ORGANISM="Pseudo-nitzschia heimii, Strain UNC1101" /LENGTH=221 /DNA_ID=CAMNT_0042633659 /DNA_START=112 /DNA_END=774 /DNA_ORIENTATION=+
MAEIVLEVDIDGLDDEVDDKVFAMQDVLVENLIDNLGVEEIQAKTILLELKRSSGYTSSDEEKSDSNEEDNDSVGSLSFDDSDVDDSEYLQDGECELCDRYIKLTRHHLIPRSTWPRMQAKLLQAAKAEENGDREKALLILGDGLEDLLNDEHRGRSNVECRFVLSSDKSVIRGILQNTCDICRQCHSTVHRTHTNMELALNYNTVEKLLKDEKISKFCKW